MQRLILFLLAIVLVQANVAHADDDDYNDELRWRRQARATSSVDSNAEPTLQNTSKAEADVASAKNNDESRVVFKPGASYAFVNPQELNAALSRVQVFGTNLIGSFKGNMTFNLSGEYEINRNYAVGLRLDYFNTLLERTASAGNLSYVDDTRLSALVPMLTGKAQTEVTSGVLVGFLAGAGIPVFYRLDYSSQRNDGVASGSASYSDTPFSGLAAGVVTIELSKSIAISTEAGYRLFDSQNMKASGNGTSFFGRSVRQGDPLSVDGVTGPVRVNMSSLYVNLGLNIGL